MIGREVNGEGDNGEIWNYSVWNVVDFSKKFSEESIDTPYYG